MHDKTKPDCYFAGHVIVRQGFKAVQVQGVEFQQLGQGGRMGHYPMHFHLAKTTAYTSGWWVSLRTAANAVGMRASEASLHWAESERRGAG